MESAEFIDRKKGASHEFISNDLWGEDPAPFLKNKQWRYVKCSDCDQAFHQFILAPSLCNALWDFCVSLSLQFCQNIVRKKPPIY